MLASLVLTHVSNSQTGSPKSSLLPRLICIWPCFIIYNSQKEITCVIFLAAIDEFDTYVLTEDSKVRRGQQEEKFMSGSLQEQKNKLVESIEVFKEIQNIEYLSHATFILFLNKVDVFREKIQTSNLIDHFDDFPEGFEKDENFALKFLKDRFINANLDRSGRPIRQIYSHQTTATGNLPWL